MRWGPSMSVALSLRLLSQNIYTRDSVFCLTDSMPMCFLKLMQTEDILGMIIFFYEQGSTTIIVMYLVVYQTEVVGE